MNGEPCGSIIKTSCLKVCDYVNLNKLSVRYVLNDTTKGSQYVLPEKFAVPVLHLGGLFHCFVLKYDMMYMYRRRVWPFTPGGIDKKVKVKGGGLNFHCWFSAQC